ncbi:MAG: MurR/RpiR family transcriptional regulator [Pseudodonghicola sp.]|nr:MurR/RpiR family transcriptional regulator [Pseudodonghicola sp.]
MVSRMAGAAALDENSFSTGVRCVQDQEQHDRTGSLLKRIHEGYGAFPAGERRVADAILNAPFEMAVWTASELAGRAGVSNATVSRIVQRLGYRNFEQARQDARKLREVGSPLFMRNQLDVDPASGRYTNLAQTEAEIIQATLFRLPAGLVQEAAGAIAEARRLHTIGSRNSRFLTDYFTAQLSQVRAGVAPLVQDGQTVAEGIAGLGPEDVVLIVGLQRRPAGFSRMVKLIERSQARIVMLADSSLRDAAGCATWTLECAVETHLAFDSYVGALTMLRLLAIECIKALGEDGRRHLNAVEALHEDLEELEEYRDRP